MYKYLDIFAFLFMQDNFLRYKIYITRDNEGKNSTTNRYNIIFRKYRTATNLKIFRICRMFNKTNIDVSKNKKVLI